MNVLKRNNSQEEFDSGKIKNAIVKAMAETTAGVDEGLAWEIATSLSQHYAILTTMPTVEQIQDRVEIALAQHNRFDAAKCYILYRNQRTQERLAHKELHYKFLTTKFLTKYTRKDDPFPNEIGKFVYYRTYARPVVSEGRRERWWETVARVVDFNIGLEYDRLKKINALTDIAINTLKQDAEFMFDSIYNLKVFPSGRSLWIAGTQASKEYPLSNFNCSMVTIDELNKFVEIFAVLMLGTGVGLSVESKYVSQLPKVRTDITLSNMAYEPVPVNERKEYTEITYHGKEIMSITIGDSKAAWQKALETYFEVVSSKQYKHIKYVMLNYNNIRPAGERLKTFGGYASGHEAIKMMFVKLDKLLKTKTTQWYTLKPIDCLDIATIIAENVISGGVRRSSEIVFCDSDDTEVINAKANLYQMDANGVWQSNDEILHRSLSNNTVFYDKKPTFEELSQHFDKIKVSGEPAFANMEAMKKRREDVQGGNPLTNILQNADLKVGKLLGRP